jgi:hypothetical protein
MNSELNDENNNFFPFQINLNLNESIDEMFIMTWIKNQLE